MGGRICENEISGYHFKDDKIDYYSTKNNEDIEIKDPVYSDIDIDNITCNDFIQKI